MVDLRQHPAWVVGVAETPLGEVRDHTELSMVAVAAREALAEAGLGLADVDGVFASRMGEQSAVQIVEYLGLRPSYVETSDMPGASFLMFVHHAMAALATGRCDVALVAYACRLRTKAAHEMTFDPASLGAQFEEPYGLPTPMGPYALAAARHMHEFGTRPEQLAEVAVAARQWAMKNPKAWKRDPLTIEQVLTSRMICSPLRRLDCCVVTDGGGVLVLTRGDRAADAAKRPVRVLGAGETVSHTLMSQAGDLASSPVGRLAARRALEMSGVGLEAIDVVQIYDAFTISVIMGLEDLGFCGRGEGGTFVEGGAIAPGGRLAVSTSGGGLSYTHPGSFGLFLVIETVRQLRGEAGDRQVPDARIGVAHAVGGHLSLGATLVMGRD